MENAVEMLYNKEALIVQANELVRSKQDELTLLEAKLIRLAISQILIEDTDLKTYSCKVTELARFLDMPLTNIYTALGTLTSSLMRKVIRMVDKTTKPKISGEYNYKLFHWVDYCEYGNGTITIKLSESLKPYLLGLNALFTEYGYNSILALPTNNSIRLLELLKSYQNVTHPNFSYESPYAEIEKDGNELVFSIDYLKEYFNCVGKYSNNGDFIIKVISASVNTINTNSTSKIVFRTAKKGRSITHVLFKMDAWEDGNFRKSLL